MIESKIDATDRLRREGRWEIASWDKDQKCKEFQRSGLKRKEATEKAWQWLVSEYPPLTDEEIESLPLVQWLAMAEFPPECDGLNDDGELPIGAYWWVDCHLLACDEQRDHAMRSEAIIGRMLDESPTLESQQLSLLAAERPRRFISQAAAKFSAVLSRWEANNPPDQVYVQELSEHLRLIKDLAGRQDGVGTISTAQSVGNLQRPGSGAWRARNDVNPVTK